MLFMGEHSRVIILFSLLSVVQGIGDSAQGFANFVLYCWSTETIRRRMCQHLPWCHRRVGPGLEADSVTAGPSQSTHHKKASVVPVTTESAVDDSPGGPMTACASRGGPGPSGWVHGMDITAADDQTPGIVHVAPVGQSH